MTDGQDNLHDDLPLDVLKAQIEQGQESVQADPLKEEDTAAPAMSEAGQAEEDQTEQDPEVEQPKPEALILGKFKSHEDLIKSYAELEKRATRAEQLRSRYRDAAGQFVELDDEGNVIGKKQKPKPQDPYNQPNMLDILEQRHAQLSEMYGPVKAQILMQTEIAQAMTRKSAEQLNGIMAEKNIERQKNSLRNDPDFSRYESEVDEYLDKMDMNSRMNPNSVQTLYWMVKGKHHQEEVEAAAREAQLKTEAIESQKSKAKVVRQGKPPAEPKVNIEELSSSEIAKRFNLEEVLRY